MTIPMTITLWFYLAGAVQLMAFLDDSYPKHRITAGDRVWIGLLSLVWPVVVTAAVLASLINLIHKPRKP